VIASSLEAFKSELLALSDLVNALPKKTLRNENLRERFRNLFRSWASVVEPEVKTYLSTRRELLKLRAEVEVLARLASKYKPVSEYKKRLRRAIQLSDRLVMYLPPSTTQRVAPPTRYMDELFIPGIPDLPISLVPNALIGWRSRFERFLRDHPFDKSVFIMIRYRKRNSSIIKSIKTAFKAAELTGILASEHKLTDDLYNPVACLLCCSRGIAVFDRPEKHEKFNPNIAYELGMLHLLGRPSLILKHGSLQTLQTDILMKVYADFSKASQIPTIIKQWAEQTE